MENISFGYLKQTKKENHRIIINNLSFVSNEITCLLRLNLTLSSPF